MPQRTRPPINRSRSFHARTGRLSVTKHRALQEILPVWRFDADQPLPLAPLLVEIGIGTGEAALDFAQSHRSWHLLGIEVHRASLAGFLLALERERPANVVVADTDAIEVLELLAPACVTELRAFFPDPWPKRKQRHRRLIQEPFLQLASRVLRPGARLLLATDDDDYAKQMSVELAASERFSIETTDRANRPITYYESRALAAGRTIFDFCAVRDGVARS